MGEWAWEPVNIMLIKNHNKYTCHSNYTSMHGYEVVFVNLIPGWQNFLKIILISFSFGKFYSILGFPLFPLFGIICLAIQNFMTVFQKHHSMITKLTKPKSPFPSATWVGRFGPQIFTLDFGAD